LPTKTPRKEAQEVRDLRRDRSQLTNLRHEMPTVLRSSGQIILLRWDDCGTSSEDDTDP